MIGKTLGQYEIEVPLGSGGMGEVYRARDTRLGRSVAIKLLPEGLAADRDRASRFEREAKALAVLNHPHVATLYGFEQWNGAYFLVMELIEGETLAERIARGPIPTGEALRIARQIAEALEAAHEKGIIHRDLKPGNIKITPDGSVKVLDFGLAKALDTAPGSAILSNSPTVMDSGAASGIILGTAGYLSPEQAKGRPADARSDIFSFGCVLYEMLAGTKPFPGDSFPEVIAGVIAREPDFTKLPVNLNPCILELLRRCLDKDTRRRWQAVADTRVEIDVILADPQGALIRTPSVKRRSPLMRAAGIVIAMLIGAAIAIPAVWYYKADAVKTVKRFTFALRDETFSRTGRQFLSISPDGSQFVYTAGKLRLRPLRELDPITVQGPENDIINPVFSPDGRSIVYLDPSDISLKRVPTAGGAPITLAVIDGNLFGLTWGADDQILFGQAQKGILRVPAKAGNPEIVIPAVNGERLQGAQLLPDGKSLLFTFTNGGNSWDKAKIAVQTPGANDRKILVEDATDGRYLPTGHLVYYARGNLWAIPYDVKSRSVNGHPVPVVEGVRFSDASGSAQFSVSNAGTLIYAEGPPPAVASTQGGLIAVIVNQGGIRSPTAMLPNNYVSVRISPNGKQLAVGTDDGKEANIWVYDLAGKSAIRQLTSGGRNLYPLWSGDGEHILYQSDREGSKAIFWQRADGTDTAKRLTTPANNAEHIPESWLKDSQKFSFRMITAGREAIWLFSISDRMATPLIANPDFNQRGSAFSPDGKWIAYFTDEVGSTGLYIQPFPTAGGAKYVIDGVPTSSNPSWSDDSKVVYFHRAGNGVIRRVQIETQPAFKASPASTLPIGGFVHDPRVRKYDITPDGKAFAMLYPPQTTTNANTPPDPTSLPQEIHVVLNWFEELKRLSPVN